MIHLIYLHIKKRSSQILKYFYFGSHFAFCHWAFKTWLKSAFSSYTFHVGNEYRGQIVFEVEFKGVLNNW
jgi:hypothetical protein